MTWVREYPHVRHPVISRGKTDACKLAQALNYTAGILVAFAAMGGALMAARGSGSGGWGVQFASPAFIAATAWVMLGSASTWQACSVWARPARQAGTVPSAGVTCA